MRAEPGHLDGHFCLLSGENTLGGEFASEGKNGADGPLKPKELNAPGTGAPLDQSRKSSLIPVFERVFSSTRFTITAQYRLMSFFDGIDPATTTE